MAVEFPMPGVVDLRMPIPGNSYEWPLDGGGTTAEPTAAKKSIVIHGTGVESPTEDGFSMARSHVNGNGWPGIGVHFVITRDDYPGRVNVTPPGAQIQYVGDLGTWRAGCLNQNPGRVHIEISGLFTGRTPSESQLRLARQLIEFMMAPNNILPSINFFSQVTYHNAVPGQNTACPGWSYPYFNEWFAYLQGGAEPTWWKPVTPPAPVPAPEPEPVVVPVAVEPIPVPEPPVIESQSDGNEVLVDEPDYVRTFKLFETPLKRKTTVEAFAIDMTGQGDTKPVEAGREVDIAGTFTSDGKDYVRTVYNVTDGFPKTGQWYGVALEAFAELPTGQAQDALIPVTIVEKDTNSFWLKLAKAIAAVIGAILKVRGNKQ